MAQTYRFGKCRVFATAPGMALWTDTSWDRRGDASLWVRAEDVTVLREGDEMSLTLIVVRDGATVLHGAEAMWAARPHIAVEAAQWQLSRCPSDLIPARQRDLDEAIATLAE